MRVIAEKKVTDTIKELCIKANLILRPDVLSALKRAYLKENNTRAKRLIQSIIKNSYIAKEEKIAICQDTGMPVVFIEIGQDVRASGDLKKAINRGIEAGYKKGYLRNSIISDPILRGSPGYSPAIIHTDIVIGNKLKITVLPKGFGCENKSALRMFLPTAKTEDIKNFIIDTVKKAGPDACPPYVVGIGIGGTADYAALLAKKALLRKGLSLKGTVPKFERELLSKINALNIGPMGLGGKTTALAVNIETYPTHIAGLPVAVNISCHALRSATAII